MIVESDHYDASNGRIERLDKFKLDYFNTPPEEISQLAADAMIVVIDLEASLREERTAAIAAQQERNEGHVRLNETSVKYVPGTLYQRISAIIEKLTNEKREVECMLKATDLEKDELRAKAGAAEARPGG